MKKLSMILPLALILCFMVYKVDRNPVRRKIHFSREAES